MNKGIFLAILVALLAGAFIGAYVMSTNKDSSSKEASQKETPKEKDRPILGPPYTPPEEKPGPILGPPYTPPEKKPLGPEVPVSNIPITIYMLEGEKLSAIRRSVPKTKSMARAALEELLSDAYNPADTVYSNQIPMGTRLLDLALRDKTLTVDLSREFSKGGGSLSMQARAAQVVFTATQFETIEDVRILLEGKEEPLGGEGLIVSEPMSRADFEDLMPAIMIDRPLAGDRVSCPLAVSGTANVFEATLQLEVGGTKKTVTATSGTGTRGNFQAVLTCNVHGKHNLRAFEYSAKDGSIINVQEERLNFR